MRQSVTNSAHGPRRCPHHPLTTWQGGLAVPLHRPHQGARALPGPGRARTAAAAWALTVLALGAAAANAAAADPPRSDSVLVRVDPDAGARATAGIGRALDAEGSRDLMAGWRAYELPSSVTLAKARGLLAGADAADAVQLDARVRPLETPDDTYFGQQWALPAMHAPAAWDALGATPPVTVAVIDTGVDTTHPDLSGHLWTNPGETPSNGIDDDANGYVDDVHGWDFADPGPQLYSPADGDSHGTHVAGIIAAERGNGTGVAGVAGDARIMVLKFLKPTGGYTSDAIVAIQYAVAEGAKVINASWGGTGYSQALCDAISQAGDAGVTFVAAAGNSGTDNDATPLWPANCPSSSLISVAATTPGDGLASFSNYGPTQVDVGAPGENILSTIPGSSYGYKSGTSMAAPQVSGIAAAVAGAAPGLAPWQTKAAITGGGVPAAALAGVTTSGRRADLLGALTLAGAGVGPDTTPPDPFTATSPAEGLVTTGVTPTFRWNPASDAQSGVAGYTVAVDGAVVAQAAAGATQATPSAPIAEGVHQWNVSALDANGNTRSTDPRTLLIDRTAPSAPAPSSPADGAGVAGPEVTLVWSPSTDGVSGVGGYRVLVDGGGVAAVDAAAHSVKVRLAPGRHTWQVVAADAAGNEATGRARSFTVGQATPAPARTRPLRLSAPARVASGRRTVLRVELTRAARVTFAVRRGSGGGVLARFTRRERAGVADVALPAGFVRRMRPKGPYVITARASGGMKDTVRLVVR